MKMRIEQLPNNRFLVYGEEDLLFFEQICKQNNISYTVESKSIVVPFVPAVTIWIHDDYRAMYFTLRYCE